MPEARREAALAGTDQAAAMVPGGAREEAVPQLRVSRPLAVVAGTVGTTTTAMAVTPREGAGAEQAFNSAATAGSEERVRAARYG